MKKYEILIRRRFKIIHSIIGRAALKLNIIIIRNTFEINAVFELALTPAGHLALLESGDSDTAPAVNRTLTQHLLDQLPTVLG